MAPIENMWAYLDGVKAVSTFDNIDEMKKKIEDATKTEEFKTAMNNSILSFYERCLIVSLSNGQMLPGRW